MGTMVQHCPLVDSHALTYRVPAVRQLVGYFQDGYP